MNLSNGVANAVITTLDAGGAPLNNFSLDARGERFVGYDGVKRAFSFRVRSKTLFNWWVIAVESVRSPQVRFVSLADALNPIAVNDIAWSGSVHGFAPKADFRLSPKTSVFNYFNLNGSRAPR